MWTNKYKEISLTWVLMFHFVIKNAITNLFSFHNFRYLLTPGLLIQCLISSFFLTLEHCHRHCVLSLLRDINCFFFLCCLICQCKSFYFSIWIYYKFSPKEPIKNFSIQIFSCKFKYLIQICSKLGMFWCESCSHRYTFFNRTSSTIKIDHKM